MYCSKCGKELNNSEKFCTECGTPIKANQEPTAEAEQQIVEAEQPTAEPQAEIGEPTAEPTAEVQSQTAEAEQPTSPVSESSATENQEAESEAAAPEKGKINGKLIALIVALAVAIAAGIFFMTQKGGEEPAEDVFADQIAQLEAEEFSGLADYQKDMLNELREKIYELVENGDIEAAQAEYDKFYALLEAFNNPTSTELQVKQIDVSDFPNVKVYFSVIDKNTGEPIEGLESEYFYIAEKADDESYVTREIMKALQLNQEENLNISMVADVSGSMIGSPIADAKNVMTDFLDLVQFEVGDKVSLISFADKVNAEIPFTDDEDLLKETITNLQLGNMTSLYDALYVSLNQIIGEEGAKCIMAFTDGEDNNSQCTPQSVIDLANKYNIPIFIIGIGSNIDRDVVTVADETGGYYTNINSVTSMADIYNQIYRAQKEMYVIEYVSEANTAEDVARQLGLGYWGKEAAGTTQYVYTPSILQEGITASENVLTDEYIIADSDVRYVTAADLENLDEWQIRVARNEIYARKGRMFDDQQLQEYFNSKSWYNGTIPASQFSSNMLSEVERANAYFIRSYENMKGFN